MHNLENEVEIEELDVEEFALKGGSTRGPKAKRYVIRVDRTKHTVEVPSLTGREILTLAGKLPPEQYKLTQKSHGGASTTIGLDTSVDFREPGVERFMTLKRDQTDGDARWSFALPDFDTRYLGTTDLRWETISDASGARWLLIHEWRVPSGYTVGQATVALQIPPGYPDAQIDMAYFHPPLTRTDGKPINALTAQDIDGKTFQRWSRHRTPEAPWRAGDDDLSSHLVLVADWLERELTKS